MSARWLTVGNSVEIHYVGEAESLPGALRIYIGKGVVMDRAE